MLNTDCELLKFKFKLTVLFNLPKNMANGRLETSIRHHGVLEVVCTQVKYNVQVRTLSKENHVSWVQKHETKNIFWQNKRLYLEGMRKILYKLKSNVYKFKKSSDGVLTIKGIFKIKLNCWNKNGNV